MAYIPTQNDLICAECYSFKIYDLGEESDKTFSLDLETVVTLKLVGADLENSIAPLVIEKRVRSKATAYHRVFFNPNGYIDELSSDYASYMTEDCAATPTEKEDTGSYTISQYTLDTEIYFADLRNGTLLYRQDESNLTASGSASAPIGMTLAYGGWNGGEGGCKSQNVLDAVGFPITLAGSGESAEQLMFPPRLSTGVTLYNSTATSSVDLAVAASDRTGLCGGLAFMCPTWGSYSVIDESKAYDCATGDYQEKYSVEDLEQYFTSWERVGPRYRFLDNKDEELFGAYFGSNGTRTVDYIDPLIFVPNVFGSVAFDGMGNSFYSLVSADAKKHNKIVTSAGGTFTPETIMGTDTFKPTTFYPVAPV